MILAIHNTFTHFDTGKCGNLTFLGYSELLMK